MKTNQSILDNNKEDDTKRCKINWNLTKTKCMNCVVIVIVAILALVIHFLNTCLEEKVKIYPKLSTGVFLLEQRNKDKRRKSIKEAKVLIK